MLQEESYYRSSHHWAQYTTHWAHPSWRQLCSQHDKHQGGLASSPTMQAMLLAAPRPPSSHFFFLLLADQHTTSYTTKRILEYFGLHTINHSALSNSQHCLLSFLCSLLRPRLVRALRRPPHRQHIPHFLLLHLTTWLRATWRAWKQQQDIVW
mgnify:CR=1 FL=1